MSIFNLFLTGGDDAGEVDPALNNTPPLGDPNAACGIGGAEAISCC